MLRIVLCLITWLFSASLLAFERSALPLAAGLHAAEPNIVADPANGRYVISWQQRLEDGCAALKVVEFDPDEGLGEIFEVAKGCDWFLNWADFPSLVIADNGDWVIHWLRRNGDDRYGYDIQLSRSRDRGQNWSAAITPHTDGTPTQHGFVSMAPVADDRVLLVWLDGRDGSTDSLSHGHHGGHDDAMSLRSVVVDRSGALSHAEQIDARVCSCCATALVRQSAGELTLVYRDRSEEEIRDIAWASYDNDQWQQHGLVHADDWRIEACPVNGPALAGRDQQTLVAWTTMDEQMALSVRWRLIEDGDAGYQLLEQGSGVAGQVSVAAQSSGWLLAWLGAGDPGTAVLRMVRIDASGEESERHDLITLPAGRSIGSPRIAALEDSAVLVWTDVLPNRVPGQRRQPTVRATLMRW